MDVAQPKWLSGCPKADLFIAKNTQNAFCNNILSLFLQAGQVWFPDSAHKTARAIVDFNREELPMLIFANWRGFSGKLFINILNFFLI
jgi:acetyl-CoA carboxylase carboxyltransferase component